MNYSYVTKSDEIHQPVKQMSTPNKSDELTREDVVTKSNSFGNTPHVDSSVIKSGLNDSNKLGAPRRPKRQRESVMPSQEVQYLDLAEQFAGWIEEEESNAEATMDYPSVTQVPIEMFPEPNAIWDFCVAYGATAMARRAKPKETITIAAGEIGIYYMAALTLFYSIEEASAGRIPPIQMMSLELRDLLYACAPTNKGNKSWVVNWDDYDLLSLINSLPFHAYQNPGISLAPWGNTEDATGRTNLNQTVLNVTFDDLRETGPQAFEIIQRYMLGTLNNVRLYPYTEDGDTTNTAMFAFSRDPNAVNPVDGFRQVVLETPLYGTDLAYYSLNFFGDKNGRRDGWSPKTVQISTIPMMYLIMHGYGKAGANKKLKHQVHMINFQSLLLNFLLQAVSAVFNSRDDRSIGEVAATGVFTDGFLDTLTAGQIITAVLQIACRRYVIHSSWAAGTVLPEENCKVIGAGSRFITTQYVDNYHTFLPLIEQLAGTSAWVDCFDTYLCPVLISRGDKQTLDYNMLGGNDLSAVLAMMYPQLEGIISYPLKAVNLLPDVIDFVPGGSTSLVSGSSCRIAGDSTNAVVSSLQAYCTIGDAVGSRDGHFHKGLYLTHYVGDTLDQQGYDITVLQAMVAALSTRPISSKEIAVYLSCFAPVMYGPINATLVGAYQVLYKRNNSIEVLDNYADYRAAKEVADGHKRAANLNAPYEYGAHIARRTYVGDGGAFFSLLTKGGKILDTGSKLFGRVLDLVAPDVAKKVNPYISQGRSGIKQLLSENVHNGVHFTPVEHGLVHPETLFHVVEHLESTGGFIFSANAPKQLNTRGKGGIPHSKPRGKVKGNPARRKGKRGNRKR